MFSKEKLIHLLIIFFISLVAIFAHGYQYAVSDQEIFIPYIAKSADPSLFPGDLLFEQFSASASVFYPLVGFLTRLFDLQAIFFAGYLVFQFIFFLGIFRLAKIILGDDRLAYLSLLPFLLPKFIGGTATSTHEIFFGYRLIGILALVYYLIFLLEQKYYQAAAVAGFGFLVHPLSIIPNLLLLPALALSNRKVKVLIKSLVIFLFLILPSVILARTDFSIFGSAFDIEWLSIIKSRADYVFPSTWSIRGWAAFALYPALILMFASKLKKSVSTQIKIIGIVSIIVFIINFLFLDILKIPTFAQFQLVRSVTPLAYIGLVMLPLALVVKNKIGKILGSVAFISLCLNLYNPGDLTKFNLQDRIQFPKKENDWINVQLWARDHTPKTALFLVPPDQTGFRIFSYRPIVGDIKDGAVVMYDRNFAKKWHEIIADFADYDYMDTESLIKLKDKYSFNYLITKSNGLLNLEVIYRNNSYIVYRI